MAAVDRIRVTLRWLAPLALAFALWWTPIPAWSAAVDEGMLTAGEVGLAVISEPHPSTIIAIDLVEPDTCESGATKERDGRVVSFAEKPDEPSKGAQLNEIVFDFATTAEAKAFFDEVRGNEAQRADCASTTKATDFELTKGPKGVGDARFTMSSTERIGGVDRAVTSVELLVGAHVVEVIFIDWNDDLKPIPKVAKKAAANL
jgi:hypothetical protein